jgi:YfiH family protein
LLDVLERRTSSTGVVYYVSPLLADIGVPHGFSTRIGGTSPEPFASLNLGNPSGEEVQDDRERIEENYRRFQAAVGFNGSSRCWVHQVHGCDTACLRRVSEFSSGVRADAIVGDDPQRLLSVRVADCVPILISSNDGRAVAAVHAGWRGVVAGVVSNAVREMRRMTNSPLVAAIGPCIGRDSFEVGSDVVGQFERSFGEDGRVNGLIGPAANGKGRVDLRRAVARQLLDVGLGAEQIDTTDRCTFRDIDEFYSHRRDKGLTGRMAAVIAPKRAVGACIER